MLAELTGHQSPAEKMVCMVLTAHALSLFAHSCESLHILAPVALHPLLHFPLNVLVINGWH